MSLTGYRCTLEFDITPRKQTLFHELPKVARQLGNCSRGRKSIRCYRVVLMEMCGVAHRIKVTSAFFFNFARWVWQGKLSLQAVTSSFIWLSITVHKWASFHFWSLVPEDPVYSAGRVWWETQLLAIQMRWASQSKLTKPQKNHKGVKLDVTH